MALTKVTGQVINDSTGLVVGVTTVGGGLSATDGFFSGIVTAVGDASFSGNVSVGGTLTYEDVTNIDAVGLITARNGIVVGSGITLSKDGDGFFTGIVTATTFKGDGSQLSNITSTTINTNADNRVITGSDTANTLNGESTLTHNAGVLSVNEPSLSTDAKIIVKGNDTNDHDIITAYSNSSTRGSFAIRNGTGIAPSFLVGTRGGSETLGLMSNGTERFRIGASGQFGIGGANYGTAGQVLKSQGSSSAPTWGAGSDLVAESSTYDMTVFTAGVNADVIDSSTRRISIGILSYSVTGSDNLRIQLRTSAGNITSGYISRGGYTSNASYAQDVASSSGFDSYGLSSNDYTWSGWLTLKNYKDNYWYMNGDLWADGASTHYWIHGHVNLGAQIVGIRFTRTGSNSFDAGEFKIFQYNTP